jgi:uncharacterized protein YfaS (alpha-2-macroglobulin family)
MTLYPGSTVRVGGTFLNKDTKQGIDPGNVTVRVLKPDGTEVTDLQIIRDAAGKYHADILVDQPGRWRYEWRSGEAADPGQFQIEASAFV